MKLVRALLGYLLCLVLSFLTVFALFVGFSTLVRALGLFVGSP